MYTYSLGVECKLCALNMSTIGSEGLTDVREAQVLERCCSVLACIDTVVQEVEWAIH